MNVSRKMKKKHLKPEFRLFADDDDENIEKVEVI